MKTRQPLDTYDELPYDMRRYYQHYGRHFSKGMYHFAVSTMRKMNKTTGKMEKMEAITKEKYEELKKRHGISIENDIAYDGPFVYSMAMSDFYGSSLPDEKSIMMFVRDYLQDEDKPDGYIFNRFYADCVLAGTPIDWGEDF